MRDCRAGLHVSSPARERGARWVVALTFSMMVVELVAGYATHSMALTADGWHMSTHAGALGLSVLAYWFARARAHDRSFAFGTGKVHALAGYTNAIVLMMVAAWMIAESVDHMLHKPAINFREALPIAVVGLFVNLLSVKLLGHEHEHQHEHDEQDHEHEHEHEHDEQDHEHEHEHDHHDHNHRAAYVHVIADAFTSVLAIIALLVGRYLGWAMLDPVMGIVGALVVLNWGVGLCRSAGKQLVDATAPVQLEEDIRRALEKIDDVRVADLHIWEMAPGRRGCLVALRTSAPREASFYRDALQGLSAFAHVTVEVHRSVA